MVWRSSELALNAVVASRRAFTGSFLGAIDWTKRLSLRLTSMREIRYLKTRIDAYKSMHCYPLPSQPTNAVTRTRSKLLHPTPQTPEHPTASYSTQPRNHPNFTPSRQSAPPCIHSPAPKPFPLPWTPQPAQLALHHPAAPYSNQPAATTTNPLHPSSAPTQQTPSSRRQCLTNWLSATRRDSIRLMRRVPCINIWLWVRIVRRRRRLVSLSRGCRRVQGSWV